MRPPADKLPLTWSKPSKTLTNKPLLRFMLTLEEHTTQLLKPMLTFSLHWSQETHAIQHVLHKTAWTYQAITENNAFLKFVDAHSIKLTFKIKLLITKMQMKKPCEMLWTTLNLFTKTSVNQLMTTNKMKFSWLTNSTISSMNKLYKSVVAIKHVLMDALQTQKMLTSSKFTNAYNTAIVKVVLFNWMKELKIHLISPCMPTKILWDLNTIKNSSIFEREFTNKLIK